MTSGVKVSDNVKLLFEEMQVVMKGADPLQRPRVAVMKIKDGVIDIVDDDIIRECKMIKKRDGFKVVQRCMKLKECCYVLYDCHYEKNNMYKEELVSMMWTPDDAPIRDRMKYASSKDSLNKIFKGIKHRLELHGREDIYNRAAFAALLGMGGGEMTKLEGCSDDDPDHNDIDSDDEQQQQQSAH